LKSANFLLTLRISMLMSKLPKNQVKVEVKVK